MFGIVKYAIASLAVGLVCITWCQVTHQLSWLSLLKFSLCLYGFLLVVSRLLQYCFNLTFFLVSETTVEVLPRLCQIKYASGTLEELLYVDMPHETQSPSGQIVLDYAKAIQESVFEQLRVVRDGQLRVVFNPDLKVRDFIVWNIILCSRFVNTLAKLFFKSEHLGLVHSSSHFVFWTSYNVMAQDQ